MSADNFWLIRKHPFGGYTRLMAFASDNYVPLVDPGQRTYPIYASVDDAIRSIDPLEDWTEYGYSVHPECAEVTS